MTNEANLNELIVEARQLAREAIEQQTAVINAETHAKQKVIDAQAQADKRHIEGYTYQQERGFDVEEKVAQNEAVGEFSNMGIGLGMMTGVGGPVGDMVGSAMTEAMGSADLGAAIAQQPQAQAAGDTTGQADEQAGGGNAKFWFECDYKFGDSPMKFYPECDAYWAAHEEEKQELEKRKEEAIAEKGRLEASIDSIPGYKDKLAWEERMAALNKEMGSLGLFKKKEKDALKAEIASLQGKVEEVKQSYSELIVTRRRELSSSGSSPSAFCGRSSGGSS